MKVKALAQCHYITLREVDEVFEVPDDFHVPEHLEVLDKPAHAGKAEHDEE